VTATEPEQVAAPPALVMMTLAVAGLSASVTAQE
jgi:hypothetical protein